MTAEGNNREQKLSRDLERGLSRRAESKGFRGKQHGKGGWGEKRIIEK